MNASEVASVLIRRFEGVSLSPYLCPAGVPTIGYGATYYRDGTKVTLHDVPLSKEGAERLLTWMVNTVYLPTVLKLCPRLYLEGNERVAAIIDFTFNLGGTNLRTSTLRRKINNGEWSQVPTELRKWNRGGGRVLRGLILRREAEIKLVTMN